MTDSMAPAADRLTVRGIDLEVVRRGTGRTIVFLHGFHTLEPEAPFLELLSQRAFVLAPSHPGFGASARPDDFETVYDLVHLYRELIDTLADDKITLVGASFGGWLAAEIAASCPPARSASSSATGKRPTSSTSSTPIPTWCAG